ncbi:MAG: NAD(P)H-hydrate epimerase [Planctomycetes bacterium]|nr:NAD(P)H-hydrate epimerase [Planctomycetota bacterium]
MPEHRPLFRAEVRDIDRIAIEEYGVPGVVLMENAGAGTARLLESLGIRGPVAVACGKGNNGGDGFVIARHLDVAGHPVKLLLACRSDEVRGDAAINLRIATRSGLTIECLAGGDETTWAAVLAGADWIVDALLGTGASGPPTGTIAAAIRGIGAARAGGSRVLAVDLPSGLDADTGAAAGDCVRADATATFVARKPGFDAPAAGAFTGRVHIVGIGAPRAAVERVSGRSAAPGTSRPAPP